MGLASIRVPNERDLEIYYAVKAHDELQTEVGKKFKLSQSRVSRICKSVADWVARAKPGRWQTVEQTTFVATDLWQHKLDRYERLADVAFQITCTAPEIVGEVKKAMVKPVAKPNPKLLAQAIDCGREQYNLAPTVTKARYTLFHKLQEDRYMGEEIAVVQALDACKFTGALHKELSSRLDVALPPLPRRDKQAIERAARNAIREEMSQRKPVRGVLPQDWEAASEAILKQPLVTPREAAERAAAEAAEAAEAERARQAAAQAEVQRIEEPGFAYEAPACESDQAYFDEPVERESPKSTNPRRAAKPFTPPASDPTLEDHHFDALDRITRHKNRSLHPPVVWHSLHDR